MADATTHGWSDCTLFHRDPDYGLVQIDVWEHLHVYRAPLITLTVVRVRVAHLPRRSTPPKPLWLVSTGEVLPAELRVVWHWYQRRFAVEHLFRFLKQALDWTTIRTFSR